MKALLHSSSEEQDCSAALESLHWDRILEKVSAIFVASALDIFASLLALLFPLVDADFAWLSSAPPSKESLVHASPPAPSFAPTPFLLAASRCILSQTLLLSSKL